MKLFHSAASPNSRRVRILLAEKGLSVPLVSVDLGKAEQHGDAYRAINPRRVVPTLLLGDGTAIGEVPVISRYIEDIHPEPPLIPALIERSTQRVKNLFADMDAHLAPPRAAMNQFAIIYEDRLTHPSA